MSGENLIRTTASTSRISDEATPSVILSCFQVGSLFQTLVEKRPDATISLDLGLTIAQVQVEPEKVTFPDGQYLGWNDLHTIQESTTGCFAVEGNKIRKIQFFSEDTGQLFSLMPTRGAPTMLISGIPMHRIKDVDPYEDTLLKIQAIQPLRGSILDTATGLGYTAIQAAASADRVTTIEINPVALQVARQNPWSRQLFGQPKIHQIIGDAFDVLQDFEPESFNHILHDPPTFSLAGDLYSEEFYTHLYRVLKPGGRVFHYIGDLDSRSGRSVSAGAIRRLEKAGFEPVARRPEAFGLLATKPGRRA